MKKKAKKKSARKSAKAPAKTSAKASATKSAPKAAPKENKTSVASLRLYSRLAIKDVTEFKKTLHETLQTSNEITIDASHVEIVDTAALQLLLAFVKEVKKRSGSIKWEDVTESLRDAAHLLDIENELGIKPHTGVIML